jgi:hypothetical protein
MKATMSPLFEKMLNEATHEEMSQIMNAAISCSCADPACKEKRAFNFKGEEYSFEEAKKCRKKN